MERNEDGSFNIYTCPACKEEYYDFQEMMDCWKVDVGQIENKRMNNTKGVDNNVNESL